MLTAVLPLAFLLASATEPPRVEHVAAVDSGILAVEVQAGRIVPMRQIPYQKEPGDRVETGRTSKLGEPRDVRLVRGGQAVGFLIGRERNVLNLFERLIGEPLDTAAADRPASYVISSADDPFYRKGAAPSGVWRKSKPNNWTDHSQLPTTRHYLYLKLPRELQPGKRYFIRFKGLNLDRAECDYVHDPDRVRSEAVHASQIGYRPDDPVKAAFLSIWLGTGGGHAYPALRFSLIDEATGERVYTGKTATVPESDPPVARLDFGDFTRAGRYRACVERIGCSYTFDIAADVWRSAFAMSMKGHYHQRNGITLGPPYTDFIRPRGFHPMDGVKVYQSTCSILYSGNGLNALGTERNNFDCLVAGKTDQVVPDVWGGYMDAGDWDRRIQHLGATRQHLELMELFPDYFKALTLNIPESGNGLPDVVNEALFGLDVYRRLQTSEGGIRGGIESSEHPVSGETSWQESQTVLTYAPDPWSSYFYAGVAARTAVVLRALGSPLASTYEESALRAIRWAETAYGKWTAGADYSKVTDRAKSAVASERNLAALEMYRLTRDRQWHEVFRSTESRRRPDADFLYARLDDSLADASLKRQAREAVLARAAEAAKLGSANAFGITTVSLTVPASQEIVRAHFLTGDRAWLDTILRSALYSAGANPLNMTMTTGVGHDWPRNLLHEDSRHFGQPAPTGLTIYGPVNLQRYKDRPDTWPINKLQTQCTPPALEWPIAEAYFDIYAWAPMNEYTVMQTLGPTAYVWGYLAARK